MWGCILQEIAFSRKHKINYCMLSILLDINLAGQFGYRHTALLMYLCILYSEKYFRDHVTFHENFSPRKFGVVLFVLLWVGTPTTREIPNLPKVAYHALIKLLLAE